MLPADKKKEDNEGFSFQDTGVKKEDMSWK